MRKCIIALLALVLAPAVASADPCNAQLPSPGEKFSGEVSHIIDGDGFCVGYGQGGIKVRLNDFNAIELYDPGGKEAKAALAKIAFNQRVECLALHRSWDRIVAHCTLAGRSIGDLMREAGVPEGGR